jgi:long-chain fatty acid transport protein
VAAAAPRAHASGFLIYDLSGEAIGRASAVSAATAEPAAVWFNPAALAYMGGVSAQAGGVLVSAQSSFSPAGGGAETESQRGNFLLPTFYANGAVSDRFALGMGVFTAFGIGIKWPEQWAGRESTISASLQTVDFNPTVAFKFNQHYSVAAGFNAVRSTVDFRSGLPALIGGDAQLVGGTWGYGGNAGFLYRPVPERLQFALTYRSRVKLPFNDGRAHFSPENPEFIPALPDQGGNATITLPDIITVGAMYRPRRALAVTFDANVVIWSTYSKITLNFDQAPPKVLDPNSQSTFTLRGGVDYATAIWPGMHLRGGLIFDRTAVPSDGVGPALPDSSRLDIALGAGYTYGPFKADLGYLLVYFFPADSVGGREGPVGTYRTIANLVGLTVAATWR